MSHPTFKIVARKAVPTIRTTVKRDWSEVLAALEAGKVLWVDTDEVTDQDVKYLSLALARRGGKFRLRTARDGATGRYIWVEER